MSWFKNAASKVTDGSEFNGGVALNGNPIVEYHQCQYCGETVVIIDDSLRDGWGFYYGNQAVKANVYQYSPVILAIKRTNGRVLDSDLKVKSILNTVYGLGKITKEERVYLTERMLPFNQVDGNCIANLHSRCHPVGKEHQYDWDLRAGHETIRLLCNSCFELTKNRYRVHLQDGRDVAISVVESRNETPESVLKELHLKGEVICKNAYIGW